MGTETKAWWREPTRGQWLTFVAAWVGWVLDAFDFTIFLLVMPLDGARVSRGRDRHRRLDHADAALAPVRRRGARARRPIVGAASCRS